MPFMYFMTHLYAYDKVTTELLTKHLIPLKVLYSTFLCGKKTLFCGVAVVDPKKYFVCHRENSQRI